MAQQCPLLFRQVDATVIRINTLFVITAVIAYLLSDVVVIVMLVIVDYLLRLYGLKHLSPTQNVSLWIQRKFSLQVKMEDAGAKRLAAYFGVGFMSALAVFGLFGIEWGVNFVAAIYLFCASLELFFGYCIACKLYYMVKKIFPRVFA